MTLGSSATGGRRIETFSRPFAGGVAGQLSRIGGTLAVGVAETVRSSAAPSTMAASTRRQRHQLACRLFSSRFADSCLTDAGLGARPTRSRLHAGTAAGSRRAVS
jgi:hypothetical protein